jgi:MFS family permease
MGLSPRAKFSVMMFLEFFIWGAWFPLASDYLSKLGFGDQSLGEVLPLPGTVVHYLMLFGLGNLKGWILNGFAVASITALFFSNQFADRNFASERFLAFSHLVGGVAILALGWTTTFWPFFLLMLLHSLFYVPTISITNSIAFANLPNAQQDFGKVRLWGTIGWIAASLPFVFILTDWSRVPSLADAGFVDWLGAALATPKTGPAYLEGVSFTYVAAGVASLLLALFSLTLPHTPPKPALTGESFAWLEAMKLLNRPFLLVLFVATFIDAAVHQGYFVMTGSFLIDRVGIQSQWVMPVMTIGQIAEIFTMAILGLVLKQFGWRTTMIFGILGHAARFAVFALFPEPAPAILINVLHGICYAFFFATLYIFVDEFFPRDARASAQGLFNLLILGLGPFAANCVWPSLETYFRVDGQVQYQTLFLIPAGTALAAAILLTLFFHPPRQKALVVPAEEEALALGGPEGQIAAGLPKGGPGIRRSS